MTNEKDQDTVTPSEIPIAKQILAASADTIEMLGTLAKKFASQGKVDDVCKLTTVLAGIKRDAYAVQAQNDAQNIAAMSMVQALQSRVGGPDEDRVTGILGSIGKGRAGARVPMKKS